MLQIYKQSNTFASNNITYFKTKIKKKNLNSKMYNKFEWNEDIISSNIINQLTRKNKIKFVLVRSVQDNSIYIPINNVFTQMLNDTYLPEQM